MKAENVHSETCTVFHLQALLGGEEGCAGKERGHDGGRLQLDSIGSQSQFLAC